MGWFAPNVIPFCTHTHRNYCCLYCESCFNRRLLTVTLRFNREFSTRIWQLSTLKPLGILSNWGEINPCVIFPTNLVRPTSFFLLFVAGKKWFCIDLCIYVDSYRLRDFFKKPRRRSGGIVIRGELSGGETARLKPLQTFSQNNNKCILQPSKFSKWLFIEKKPREVISFRPCFLCEY